MNKEFEKYIEDNYSDKEYNKIKLILNGINSCGVGPIENISEYELNLFKESKLISMNNTCYEINSFGLKNKKIDLILKDYLTAEKPDLEAFKKKDSKLKQLDPGAYDLFIRVGLDAGKLNILNEITLVLKNERI